MHVYIHRNTYVDDVNTQVQRWQRKSGQDKREEERNNYEVIKHDKD